MCARVTLVSWEEIRDIAHHVQARILRDDHVEWGGQARPGGLLPALAPLDDGGNQPSDAQLQIASFTWGYPLSDKGKLVYNARIENSSGALWASSFASRRAIVPVSAFFEPHMTETERNPKTRRMGKRAYMFNSPSGDPLLIGAIFQNDRISIVTTEPNASVASIHKRMPLVLSFEEVPTWLGGQWSVLADRRNIELASAPEHPIADEPQQLTLF